MGILEIHFHDSQFEWTFDPEATNTGALPFGGGSESASEQSETVHDTGTATPSAVSKLGSVGMVALVVAGAIAFNRLRSRRARKAAEAEPESRGRRLSLSRLRSR